MDFLSIKMFSMCNGSLMYNLSAYTRAINSSESSIRPCVPINNTVYSHRSLVNKTPGGRRRRFFVDHAHRRKKTPLLLIVYCAH